MRGIRDVFPGDSIADLVVDALALGGLRLHDGDILVVKHKIVSKAEDRKVALDSREAVAAARQFALANDTLMLGWWSSHCAKPSASCARSMF